jgi:hypothetical protein
MNLTLPLRSFTSQCCVALLNSIWLARETSSRPSSCSGTASVQRQWAVPSGLNEMVIFMVVIFEVAVEQKWSRSCFGAWLAA